jgi:hypothetical protein
MPLLTEDKKMEIVMTLGYPYTSTTLFTVLTNTFPQMILDKINFFLSEISRIDSSIISAFENLAIKKVDEIEFFSSEKETDVTARFYADRMRFVNQLSDLTTIPKAYGYRHEITYQ